MKLLSIDVGMKYLAYCLLSVSTDRTYTIEGWGILNLCEKKSQYHCQGRLKNNRTCKKRSRFYKQNTYYCKNHAKGKGLHIPTNDMKPIKLRRQKVAYLKAFCKERNYKLKKKPLKKDYLDTIFMDLSNNYFSFVENVDSRKIDLITYGTRIKEIFSSSFW